MTEAIVIALAAGLLATARWALSGFHAARRVHPPRGWTETDARADAERALERSGDLGASTGHVRAWRDLLSAAAEEAARAPVGGEAPEGREALRSAFDREERRIRSALSDLETPGASGPARSGDAWEGTDQWSG
ncbi:hypothetical protein ACIBFB_07185 [Nocardiopsis sp. NPDC050513]|uniref:hypothetical protein n=1 Tax=Nocardiopsis sp. NPDC050513 TaxID=3364338 RepID=UPI0037AC934B